MSRALASIYRHPIKAHGRENLASVVLSAGECLPGDRRWAVAHEAAKLVEGWNPCSNFHRGAKAPALMAITAELDGDSVVLHHPDRPDLRFKPDDTADLAGFLDWVAPLSPPGRARPAQIVSAGRGMTDSPYPSVSILADASLRALSQQMGQDLSPHRFRANLRVEGTSPFEEFDWIGQELQIGEATLKIEARITRCNATSANPETGRIDADILDTLAARYGHRDFGVYATVTKSGTIKLNDKVTLL